MTFLVRTTANLLIALSIGLIFFVGSTVMAQDDREASVKKRDKYIC